MRFHCAHITQVSSVPIFFFHSFIYLIAYRLQFYILFNQGYFTSGTHHQYQNGPTYPEDIDSGSILSSI